MKRIVFRLVLLVAVILLPLGVYEGLGFVFGERFGEKDIAAALVSVYGTDGNPECYKAFAVIINTLIETGDFSLVKEDFFTAEYEECEAVSEAIKATEGQVILFQNAPILAAFHQSSGGSTLSYESVFGEDIAYLKSVESDSVTERQTFSAAETERLFGASGEIRTVSDGGVVREVTIGEISVSADMFREKLGILSTVFEIEEGEGEITVVSKGIGHQVGFSVSGAEKLAAEGKSYEDILKHYFVGVSIGKRSK